jgi:hypothetical protein
MSLLLRVFTIISLVFLFSCGKGPTQKEELSLLAKEALNKRDYQKASYLYLKLSQKYPNKKEFKIGLADSYLGIGGFELFDFLIQVTHTIENSFKSEELFLELRKFSKKYFSISREKESYIKKALDIYYLYDEETNINSSKEQKLKRGLVHIFLLTQNIKNLFKKIDDEISQIPQPTNNDDIQREYEKFVAKYLIYVDASIFHSFKAYTNLRASFNEIISLLIEVDKALERSFGKPYLQIKDELENLTFEKLIALFIKYNPEIYKDIMQKVLQTCDRKVALVKLMILKDTIIRDYQNNEFQNSALKLVNETIKYLKSHDASICHNSF